MADLRFKVGAAVDASWDVVFASILAKAKKARAQIGAEMTGAGRGLAKPFADGGSQASTALGKIGGAAKKTASDSAIAARALSQMADGARERFEDLVRSLKRLPPEMAIVAREAEREVARIQRASARESLGLSNGRGAGPNMAYRMGYWSMKNFSAVTPTLNMGMNVARDLAHGVGINTDLGSLMQQSVEREDLATSLSIQGKKSYTGAGDRNHNQVAASTLSQEAFGAGNATGFDANEILRAQTKFVDLSGDLATSRTMMADLGRVANSTGTDLESTATAAAQISRELDTSFGDDQQGKAKAMNEILRNLAGQGKEGAVELKQYASQMAKVAAAASQLGGSRQEAFALTGMLVQQSRASGGATTATLAATTVAAFMRDVSKDAARKKPDMSFSRDLFETDGHGHRTAIKSPVKIIEAAVLKAKGDEVTLRSWFKNSNSFRAVEGFASVYRNAERQTPGSGKKVLEDTLQKLHDATISEEDERQANADKLSETKGQVQTINNGLAEVADHLRSTIAPKLASTGQDLVAAAGHVADFVGWAAGHPWEGVGVALAASIAKAGVEQSIRLAIEKAAGAEGGIKFLGPIAMTAGAVTLMAMEAIDSKAKADAAATGAAATADAQTGADIAAADAHGTAADLPKLQADRAKLENQVTQDQSNVEGTSARGVFGTIAQLGGSTAINDESAKELHEHQKSLDELKTAIERLTDRIQRGGGVTGGGSPPRAPAGQPTNQQRGP